MSNADNLAGWLGQLEAPPVEEHRGQLRMAGRLAARWTDRLVFVTGLGWHAWDGTRWRPDDDGTALRAVADTLRAAVHEAADLPKEERSQLLGDVRRCESASAAEGVLTWSAAVPHLRATVADLDRDPWLLNTAGGTYDLRTGGTKPADPHDRITKVTGAAVGEADNVPTAWTDFLDEVLPDEPIRRFLQRIAGLALLGAVREHVLPVVTGVGANGKSTFVGAVTAALGDYAIAADPELLVERDRAHPTGLLDLRGTRLVVCQESDAGRRLAVATAKRLTGGDAIRARRMRQDFVEFRPTHTAVLVTNHPPRVPADDLALWRRLRVVPFSVVIEEPDPDLPERLALDLPGVLRWAVDGYADYSSTGLAEPPGVLTATSAYRVSNDAVARFVDDRCEQGPDLRVAPRALHVAYVAWCRDNDERPAGERDFTAAIESRGFYRERAARGRWLVGIALHDGTGTIPLHGSGERR